MVKIKVRPIFTLILILISTLSYAQDKNGAIIPEKTVNLKSKDLEELPTLNPVWRDKNPSGFLTEKEKSMQKPIKDFDKLMEKASRVAIAQSRGIKSAESYEPKFFRYKVSGEKNLSTYWEIEKRCALRPGTLASINGITSAYENLVGKTIIIPAAYGLFISPKDESNLGIIIYSKYSSNIEKSKIVCYNIDDVPFYFVPNVSFGMEETFFFTYKETKKQRAILDSTGEEIEERVKPNKAMSQIRLPLDKKDMIALTSPFGYRTSPVYGTWKKHAGVDLAAKEGTPVYACADGVVSETVAMHGVFGNVIVIKHDGGFSSTYAHLSKMEVNKKTPIEQGQLIGLVGHTGAATGPHLHFEIRKNGAAQNPADFLDLQG